MAISPITEAPPVAGSTDCPLTAALHAIGGKWSLICLYWLDSGTRRFNELRRLMPDISHKVLAETLRHLEHEGMVRRTVHSQAPSHVEYTISAHGESVRPLIHAVRLWGWEHLAREKTPTRPRTCRTPVTDS